MPKPKDPRTPDEIVEDGIIATLKRIAKKKGKALLR
jgi:hypothetical protein